MGEINCYAFFSRTLYCTVCTDFLQTVDRNLYTGAIVGGLDCKTASVIAYMIDAACSALAATKLVKLLS
jgi:hypothetical protein